MPEEGSLGSRNGPLRFDLRLPANTVSVLAARAVVRALHDFIDEEALYRLELIVSELMTNAVCHGSPDGAESVQLELVVDGAMVHGCIADSGPQFSMPSKRPVPDGTGGFGLLIADGLSDSLEISRSNVGNVVRFALPTKPRPSWVE